VLDRTTNVIELKKLMIEKGLEHIKDLSKAVGVTTNTLSRILNGHSHPSSNVINKLVVALDIPATKAWDIFFGTNSRST